MVANAPIRLTVSVSGNKAQIEHVMLPAPMHQSDLRLLELTVNDVKHTIRLLDPISVRGGLTIVAEIPDWTAPRPGPTPLERFLDQEIGV